MRIFFIKTWESVKQLIAWFPIIWNTRDWDRDYLLEIMEFKMNRMYDALSGEDAVGEQAVEDLWALRRCALILNMLQNEGWKDNAYDEHYEKFPMRSLEDLIGTSEDHPGLRVMKPMGKEESKSFKEAMKQAEKDHKKLVTEFGKLFAERYRNWWD